MAKKLTEQWSSKWAFIIAATGAAVGLGNVWRFPYMAGAYGGSAFVILYLIFVVFIGLPIMISEILIGRRARLNPVDALETLAVESHHSARWKWLGWWGALGLLIVLSFYSVVSGWAIAYLYHALRIGFHHNSVQAIQTMWTQFLASPWQLIGWHTAFLMLTIGVILKGVQRGLERATKCMMPGLYIILFALVIYGMVFGDFAQAVHFLFDFHIEKITMPIVIAALGHAFFTLALGAGAMLTYGVYVPRNVNIASAVVIVALLDVLVAMLSGLAIFPLVFSHHLAVNSGPGLMFVTLPIAFADIPYGSYIGALFFLLLLCAAWTASLNLAEPMVIILQEKLKISRQKAALLVGLLAWVLGIAIALSFNVWQHFSIFHANLFDIATSIPTDVILPIGGLGFAIFAGYVMKKHFTQTEVVPSIYPVWRFLIRTVCPVGIVIIFVAGIIEMIK